MVDRSDINDALKKKLFGGEISSFDELMSRTFDTLIISVCKTKQVTKTGGPLFNNPTNIEFLKSRVNKRLVIIGKA